MCSLIAVSEFSDAGTDDWYTPYIIAATKAGLVKGIGDGTVGANLQITRQDIATLIYRAVEHLMESGDVSMFGDADSIADYAKEAIGALAGAGIINGMGDGTVAPQNNATRAEAAKMLAGIYQYMQSKANETIAENSQNTLAMMFVSPFLANLPLSDISITTSNVVIANE